MEDTADYWLLDFRSPFPVPHSPLPLPAPRSPLPVPHFSNIQSQLAQMVHGHHAVYMYMTYPMRFQAY